jgi:hypothetical protein
MKGNPKYSRTNSANLNEGNYPQSRTFQGAYPVPEAGTPDPNASATTYGNIPPGDEKPQVQDTSEQDRVARLAGVAVGDKFTQASVNEQATYGMSIPSSSQAAAGSTTNYPSGTYPANPTPMQGPGDKPSTQAVMPKVQVQGDPRQVYGIKLRPRRQVP